MASLFVQITGHCIVQVLAVSRNKLKQQTQKRKAI